MMKNYDALKLENQLCFPLYAAAREVIKRYYPYLRKLSLTYTQYIAMMVLWEKGNITAKELGQKLYLDSGTLTPVLKSLEQKGYILRHRSAKDERVLLVAITEKGRELRQEAEKIPQQMGGCFPLEPDEAATLYRLLYKTLESKK